MAWKRFSRIMMLRQPMFKNTTEFMDRAHETHGITFIRKKDIPVKSPDASPLDFVGFGYLKQKLKERHIFSIAQLRDIANNIWTEIPNELVMRVFQSWRKRLILIRENKGNHIENVSQLHRKPLKSYNR